MRPMRVRLLLFFAAFRIAARLSWAPKRTRALPIALASFLLLGCGVRLTALPDDREDYLRYVAFRGPVNDKFLLRWPTGKMPLEANNRAQRLTLSMATVLGLDLVHQGTT